MTVLEYDRKLDELENQKKKLILDIKEIYQQIQIKCITFMKEKIKTEIESHVRDKPEITKSLSKEELSNIKTIMNDLIENIDEQLPICFADKEYYKTIKPDIACMYEFDTPKNANKSIIALLETLMQPVGDILVKYKYDKQKGRYILDYMLNKQIISDLDLYGKKCVEYLKLIIEIDNCQKEKAKKEAEDLWDQI